VIDARLAGVDEVEADILRVEDECLRLSVVCLSNRGRGDYECDGSGKTQENFNVATIGVEVIPRSVIAVTANNPLQDP